MKFEKLFGKSKFKNGIEINNRIVMAHLIMMN